MRDTSAKGLENTIREYFDACTQADADRIASYWTEDGVHYFPAGAPQGTFVGAKTIAAGWVSAVERFGSSWTVDRILVDAARLEAVIEWTHFKPKLGVYLRGDEWYVFSPEGLIQEIRAYYACPPPPGDPLAHELGDFDYQALGYPMAPVTTGR